MWLRFAPRFPTPTGAPARAEDLRRTYGAAGSGVIGGPNTVAGPDRDAENSLVTSHERLSEMAHTLVQVPGIDAVVLGGSRARGTHHHGSDVDLGLYYNRDQLDLDALSEATGRFTGTGPVQISGPGGWGPWVDGGGWLTVDGRPVDWILRDIGRVREQCRRAVRGDFAFHAQPGHPLGFLDVSYAGEVATCLPLADPVGVVAEMQSLVQPYPTALREAMIGNLWQADFLLEAAEKGIPKQDIAYVMLCCSTALMLCAHAWHATAGNWPTNEKGVVVDVALLDLDTGDFATNARRALALAGADQDDLMLMLDRVSKVVSETVKVLHPKN